MPYLLFEPAPALMPPDRKRPLVVFLHGSGERGDDLDKVKKHGPPAQFMKGDGLPFVLLAPQCPPGVWWNADDVIRLVEKVIRDHDIHPARVHLTGLSMGGFATWAILAKKPDLFASAVPICGGGDPETVGRFKHIPIWAFHGTADEMVAVSRTKAMDEALRAAGATDFHATYYDGVGHDSWTRTYENPAVYAWMMQRSR
ncbi:prolyl oligopeptidase family serine peptidase [Haloferula sp. A504]|uniref:carboxylesterase family protein n=1 Tax=Haloferula sp. A504 TaxID=3373601 RepID=UPI0031C45387|nr:prolyl oligopeptidase family serine peptidase [Verrucomicrobiaceae bacterium E54]